jgi:hypothetical protein
MGWVNRNQAKIFPKSRQKPAWMWITSVKMLKEMGDPLLTAGDKWEGIVQ